MLKVINDIKTMVAEQRQAEQRLWEAQADKANADQNLVNALSNEGLTDLLKVNHSRLRQYLRSQGE